MNITPLTDEKVVAERHDVEIMRRKHLWPYGPFLPLKHRVMIDVHGVPRTSILYYSNSNPKTQRAYVFIPGANMYSIPAEFWTEPARYRSGDETLLFEIIVEGWIVQ